MTTAAPRYRVALTRVVWLVLLVLLTWGLLTFLGRHTHFLYSIRGMYGTVPPIGSLLDPHHGLWYTARTAKTPDHETLEIPGLKEPVTVVRDKRGIPHVFAETDRDAVIATGYVVAQDRLFQLDFVPRAAAGELSAIFGPDLVGTDRYLRSTGMEWGAQMNLDSIQVENGISNDLLNWFSTGVNAWIEQLSDHELPIEFRLLGYRPNRYEPIDGMRVLQFMAFDLSFRSDDASYGGVAAAMNGEEFAKLFPRKSFLFEPIIPGKPADSPQPTMRSMSLPDSVNVPDSLARGFVRPTGLLVPSSGPQSDLHFPGFEPGKGSNNWAVTGGRSETGGALLAGDMHLNLTLPAIWYEMHIVTPNENTHGVLIPGAPLLVEAFNDHHGWTFTNTGSDQIDHYELVVDSTGTAYRFNEKWLAFDLVVDTIEVRGLGWIPDTLRFTRFGPVMGWPDNPIAIQWTAHKRARTIRALWNMHRAQNLEQFQQALMYWDSPMQNILYADVDGNIAIRSTGHLPLRKAGQGAGLLDGSRDTFDWIGRIPFDELPFAANPDQEYLASANQQPTGDWYPYYLGYDWPRSYRSIRINQLLRSKSMHGMADMMAYQSDIHTVQYDLFVPMLDTLTGLSEDASFIRHLLVGWGGDATLESPGPLVLDEYLGILDGLVWDEFSATGLRKPREEQIYRLLSSEPDSRWLDIQDTELKIETAHEILRLALEATADTMRSQYGWDSESWAWDRHHHLEIPHLTKSNALRALAAGPFSYPGFSNTLSPAPGRTTTNGASWRMIVDFSTNPPSGFGVYPGGQSGNPYSAHYADQISMFTHFGYYRLTRPMTPGLMEDRNVIATLELNPPNPPSQGEQQPDD